MLSGTILILCACGKEVYEPEDTRQEDVENTQTESEKVDDEASNIEIEQQTIEESAEEVGMPQEKEEHDDASEEKEVIPEEARELLEYLFDYLYEDQSNMVEIELYETEDELYYKWKIRYSSGELSNPCVLEYSYTTRDGLYYEFVTYAEVWEIYYDKEGIEHKEHTRDSYGDFLLVNTENLEVISRWILNEDENAESDYIENEKYWEIIRSYAEGNK